ncbi:MAG: hypothetical protein JWL97_3505 [Gemmatimonadales bacterium]|nr:hypothetical protein [Gemmatimonadales bacterium]
MSNVTATLTNPLSAAYAGQLQASVVRAYETGETITLPAAQAKRLIDAGMVSGVDPKDTAAVAAFLGQVPATAPAYQVATMFAATDIVNVSKVTGDAANRSVTYADGKRSWGGGTAAPDVDLFRSAVGVLSTSNWLRAVQGVRVNTTDVGSGVGVIGIGNATTAPTAAPIGGGVLFVEAGALKFRGPTTTTVIAPA